MGEGPQGSKRELLAERNEFNITSGLSISSRALRAASLELRANPIYQLTERLTERVGAVR